MTLLVLHDLLSRIVIFIITLSSTRPSPQLIDYVPTPESATILEPSSDNSKHAPSNSKSAWDDAQNATLEATLPPCSVRLTRFLHWHRDYVVGANFKTRYPLAGCISYASLSEPYCVFLVQSRKLLNLLHFLRHLKINIGSMPCQPRYVL